MSRIAQRVGKYELQCWTDGHPEWVSVYRDEGCGLKEVLRGIHPDELPDLHWAIGRLMDRLATERASKAARA